jgi:4-diphosphocytidyl-2-C-methyl-D-erythritol kinase
MCLFFIYGTNAWAEGIGEQLQPINLLDAYYVVLTPDVHVSTAEIFANKQLTKNSNPQIMSTFSGVAQLSATDSAGGNIKSEFTNSLEKVVCSLYRIVSDCL